MNSYIIPVLLCCLATCYGKPLRNSEATVSSFLNNLVTLDTRVNSLVNLNYQNMASKKDPTHDNAKSPLFTSVDDSVLQGATYTALTNLLGYYNNLDSNAEQVISKEWSLAITQFIETVAATPVMQSATQFLVEQQLVADQTAFKNTLYNLWFAPYARSSVEGSSGFKSVFAGESIDGVISSLSNWVQFFTLENAGTLNYHGWFQKSNEVAIDLQFTLNDELAFEQSILLNTSPEFELAAYTVCALTGSPCTVEIEGVEITINVALIGSAIDNAYPSLTGNSKKTTHSGTATTKRGSITDAALQTLIDNMWKVDTDKPASGDIVMNWGSRVSGNSDTSPQPLFTSVKEANIFEKSQYAALIETYDKNLFTADVCTAEPTMSGFRKQYLQNVFDIFTATPMFNLAYEYMKENGVKGSENLTSFKTNVLWPLWFGTYSRCKGTLGSSGWEHVFSGEFKDTTVDGQHDWVRYYLLEKAGKINYHGYYTHAENLIGTFQYTWEKATKPKGGFFTGTSPAFDFSVLTTCALTHSGANACRFSLDSHPITVTSYTQSCDAGTCLSTAYPSDG